MRETGTATPGMRVVRQSRRKRKTTPITRITEMTSVRSTSWTEARIVVVRSMIGSILIAAGTAAFSCGMRARTRSTVSMMFAFGWRKTMRRTAGFPRK